ncbi:hypothetical protein ACSS6W_002016 [Trichoderma asperelloides]
MPGAGRGLASTSTSAAHTLFISFTVLGIAQDCTASYLQTSSLNNKNNEQRVSRAFSQHFPFCRPEGCDPSAPSFENFEYLFGVDCGSNDAIEIYSERESSPSSTAYSPSSENENADSTLLQLGDSFGTQQDRFLGRGHGHGPNIPHSPIIDPTHHPWEETYPPLEETLPPLENIQQQQQQATSPISVEETTTGSQDNGTARPRCNICDRNFASKSILARHFKIKHAVNREYWVCTVKGCSKYMKEVSMKYNFRRHCRTKHPRVDLKQFGL